MRPVRADEAEDLVKWKPMMILDKTLYGPAYIESLVTRNPGLVTSKSYGRKTFPLEIWHMILNIITNDPVSHDFALLRANYIEVGGKMDKTLACNKINRWNLLGMLRSNYAIGNANMYLARPDLAFHVLPNPFRLDDASQPWKIPTLLFSSKIKSLYVRVTVPDFIKHLEDGKCGNCFNTRTIRRDITREIDGQQDFSRLRWSMSLPVLCPLCVGLDATNRCIELSSLLQTRGYLAWLRKELTRLLEVEEPFNQHLAHHLEMEYGFSQ
jgi:hypothetical protein